MHILSLLFSAMVFASVWYFRARAAKRAADTLYDVAGHLKDKLNRKRLLNKLDASSIGAIGDPRVAAAVIAVAIASDEGTMSANTTSVLIEQLGTVTGLADPESEVVFAEWAIKDIADIHSLNERLFPTFMENLSAEQRKELVDMIKLVVSADGEASLSQIQAIDDLESRFMQAR